MWRSFWGNAASADARHLPLGVKLRLLHRATLPSLTYRASRWPPQKFIRSAVDKLQRKMTGILLRLEVSPNETPADFNRRRGRVAGSYCKKAGWWSDTWFKRAILWDEHVNRAHQHRSWCAPLLLWRDSLWLQERRLARGSASSAAGRTATRSYHGRVHARWQEAIAFAKL